MKRSLLATAVVLSMFGGAMCPSGEAAVQVTWDGTTDNQWQNGNWTLNGVPGQTANAAIGQDGNNGGRGGVDMIIGNGAQVVNDPNNGNMGGLGDFKPRMDITPGGSLTIKQGASLSLDSHSDVDGRWTRV